MNMSFQIEGAKELEVKLRTLPARLEKKVIRQAVRKGHALMLRQAKANALSIVGGNMGKLISRNLILRATKKQKRGSYRMGVWIRADRDDLFARRSEGFGNLRIGEVVALGGQEERHYIPAAIEYGHMAGDTYVPPISFARSAAESTRNERMRILTDALRTGLLREAIKAR